MPNNSTYLDELALLNQQNFLGGAATYGKAIKEKNQNETLVDLYNKFKADKNELQTTMEQTGDFNKFLTTSKVEGEEQGAPEVGAFIDFMKSVDEMGAYTKLYQPFITAFATLGDEGVKVATTLSNELATQLDLASKKDEAIFRNLQYKQLKQTYEWDRAQYDKFITDTKFSQDSMKAASYINKSKSFSEMLPETVDYNDKNALNRYMIAENTALQEAKQLAKQDGVTIDDDAFLAGLKLAKDWSGKGFKYIIDPSKYGTSTSPFSGMERDYMLGEMQRASWRYNHLSPDFKRNLTLFMNDPIKNANLREDLISGTPPVTGKSAEEAFGELYEMYKPEGRYAQLWSMASATIPGFNDIKLTDIGRTSLYKSSGEEEFPTPKMKMPSLYPEIIRLNDSGSFQTQDFLWNSQWLENYANTLEEEAQKRKGEIDYFQDAYDQTNQIKQSLHEISEETKRR